MEWQSLSDSTSIYSMVYFKTTIETYSSEKEKFFLSITVHWQSQLVT